MSILTDNRTITAAESLAQLNRGDPSALEHFYNKYYTSLVFFSDSIIRDRPQAEDIALECFVKLWAIRTGIETENKLRAYLFTLARNASLDSLRHRKVAVRALESTAPTEADESIESKVIASELFRIIYEEIQALPNQYRQVVELMYLQDMSSTEAASQLGITIDNLRQRKARAVKHLKSELLKKGIDTLTLCLFFFQ